MEPLAIKSQLTLLELGLIAVVVAASWHFFKIICTGLGAKLFNQLQSDYLTEAKFEELCGERRSHCEVCRDVGTIKSVLFEMANHLDVPYAKYSDLVGPHNRRKDDHE